MSMVDPLDGLEPEIHSLEIKPGKFIFLRALDGQGRKIIRQLAKDGQADATEVAALGIVRGEHDSTLAYVTDAQKQTLAGKDGEVLHRIASKVMQISGLSQDAEENAGKNS